MSSIVRWCLCVVAWCATSAAAACSREDAYNKMMALNQYGMKLQAALPDPLKDPAGYNANYQRVIDFGARLGGVGKTLAAQQYEEACAKYDALARDYRVDIAGQHVRPLSEIEAEAKKPANFSITSSTKASGQLAPLVINIFKGVRSGR